jgi:hypothetical protein
MMTEIRFIVADDINSLQKSMSVQHFADSDMYFSSAHRKQCYVYVYCNNGYTNASQ